MTVVLLAKIFLQLNVMIALSYLLFRFIKKMIPASSHRQLQNSARIVFMSALLVVPCLYLFPSPRIVFPEMRTFVAPSENDGSTVMAEARTPRQLLEFLPPQPRALSKSSSVWRSLSSIGMERILYCLFVVYILGALGVLLRSLVSYRALTKKLSSLPLMRCFQKVYVAVADDLAVPLSAYASGRAYVVMPSSIFLNPCDFKIAMLHELQHHRQGDTRWVLFFELVQAAFYLNPFTYRWKKLLTELQEYACDEALIGQKHVPSRAYAECLVRTAEIALQNQRHFVGTTMMTMDLKGRNFKSFFGRRIHMFVKYRHVKINKGRGIGLCLASSLLCVAIAYGAQGPFRSNEDENFSIQKTLSWQPDVQAIAMEELQSAITQSKAKSGFVIVADPSSGRILANANIGGPKDEPNWALSRRMEPASVIKTLIVASAIEQEKTSSYEELFCEKGSYRSGNMTIKDWKAFGHTTVAQAIIKSSNICTVKIAERMGSEQLVDAFKQFGFGEDGVTKEFPFARAGVLPSFDDFVPYAAIGFGYFITPLEMVQAYAVIANGGLLVKPQPYQESDTTSVVLRRVLSPEVAYQMRGMLADVVKKGTGQHAGSNLYSMAGKTGTGFTTKAYEHLLTNNDTNLASFIGFAPAQKPKVEVYVVLSYPEDKGITGGTHAAPVFKRVAERVLEKMKVPYEKL